MKAVQFAVLALVVSGACQEPAPNVWERSMPAPPSARSETAPPPVATKPDVRAEDAPEAAKESAEEVDEPVAAREEEEPAKPVVVTPPTEAKPDEAKPDEAKPDEAKPDEATARTGAAAAAAAAAKYSAWGAVHALVGSTVRLGVIISGDDAIALTADNIVGVTRDGGESWGLIRHDNGVVLAVAGAAGGPFMAVGKAGYAAISSDGKRWRDLPRYTNDDLVAVAVGARGTVAVTKKGEQFVVYGLDGASGALGAFPDKLRVKGVVADQEAFIALGGKVPYNSLDGTVWAPLDMPLPKPVVRGDVTSQGVCALGRVDKINGVVCEVKGDGFGVDGTRALVAQGALFFTTANGGASWTPALAPITGVSGVVASGGRLIAFGKKGAIATSSDEGASWEVVTTHVTKNLLSALADGSTVLLAGDGGTVLRSSDGGVSFVEVMTPQKGALKQLAKLSTGSVVALMSATKAIESVDGGASWLDVVDPTILVDVSTPGKAGKCDDRIPAAGEVCKLQKRVTSPALVPNAKGVSFEGDVGLAFGEYGLLMTTRDGGASWTARSGFTVRALGVFEARDNVVLAVGNPDVVVSSDGGASFQRYLLPREAGKVRDVHITQGGQFLYAAGDGGTVLRAVGADPSYWQMLDVGGVGRGGRKVTSSFASLHEVGSSPEAGGILFVAGARGELYRSDNRGDDWMAIATGTPQPVQRMAADGDTVVAVTYSDRKGGNLLLKSDDGGQHFYVAREISHQGPVDLFVLAGGVLRYKDRRSSDFGATWTRDPDERYWNGAVDTFDAGLSLVDFDSRYVRDTIYLVGPEKDDWVILDGVQTRLAQFKCGKDSGCWMLHEGQVYRPL